MAAIILGFTGNIVRVLHLSDSKEIISKDQITLSFNVNEISGSKKNTDELTSEFSEQILKIINSQSAEPLTAGVLIDTSQTFLNVIPVDFNEDTNSINSHILWELSNYFPDSYKNFNIKYYRLHNNSFSNGIDEVLLIAIDKNRVELIKKLCNGSNIRIRNIEIDQFAVEKCLRERYSADLINKSIMIIGCKNSRLDFSLINSEALRYYDYDVFQGRHFRPALVNQMNFFSSAFSNDNIQKIFLYGYEGTDEIKKFLGEEFGDIEVSYIDTDVTDSSFAPLYGLALKNL